MNFNSVSNSNPKPHTASRKLQSGAKKLILIVLTVVAAATAAGFSAPEAQASASCRYLSSTLYGCRWYSTTTETVISSALKEPGYYQTADEAVYRWNGRTWALWALQRNVWYRYFNWNFWDHRGCEVLDLSRNTMLVRDSQGMLQAVACVGG